MSEGPFRAAPRAAASGERFPASAKGAGPAPDLHLWRFVLAPRSPEPSAGPACQWRIRPFRRAESFRAPPVADPQETLADRRASAETIPTPERSVATAMALFPLRRHRHLPLWRTPWPVRTGR